MDGEQPLVVTSQHTVTNTITAPEDYLSILQPSEPSATLFETNTYYSTMVLTKTLSDSDVSKIISTTDVVRQVVITELLPSKRTSVMTSYIAIDADGNKSPAEKSDILSSPFLLETDVVKTYFVTYTYYNTYLKDGSTIVKTNVSTSSDIVTEKLYIYPTKRPPSSQSTSITRNAIPIRIESLENSIGQDEPTYNDEYQSNELMNESLRQTINVYATKTFMTTFTYFTTLLQGPSNTDAINSATISLDDDENGNERLSTVVNSHTRVIENIVTESIPINFLPSSAVHKFKLLFFGDEQHHSQLRDNRYTTVATLIGGQALEITAVKNTIDPTTKRKESHNMMQTTALNSQNLDSSESESEEQLIEIDNTKNELDNDQESAGTSDVEVLAANPSIESNNNNNNYEPSPALKTNNTKIIKTTAASPVSNLIGSINFNGLKVLRPMIDAVAGLINTNFRLNWHNDSVASNRCVIYKCFFFSISDRNFHSFIYFFFFNEK